ncbi:MAG: ABC-F family ATP-binding cassette domain-containing protein [Clostridia bacterium]|nr:ABC-F family ATP-binding cassette domain-containing protein [Clostridia bacterium]
MTLISIRGLTFAYPGSPDNVFDNISVDLDSNWRLGLIGRNGRGKTTLLRLLSGQYAYSGSIVSQEQFSYFPYPVKNSEQPCVELIAGLAAEREMWEIERELGLLGLNSASRSRSFALLSPGEQSRALLAALFLRGDCLPLIDEPTNHLDMAARQIVGDYLGGKRGFILVSHDRDLLDRCTDHILALNKSGVELIQGNFSAWQENQRRREQYVRTEREKLQAEITTMRKAAQQGSAWAEQVEKSKYAQRNSGVKPDRGYIGAKSARLMKKARNYAARQEKAAAKKTLLLKDQESCAAIKLIPAAYHSRRLLSLENLEIFYDKQKVCGPLSFSLERGERLAVLGGNGSGKSSLLKLILGQDLAYRGGLYRGGGLKISYVPQQTTGLGGSLNDFAARRGLEPSLFFALLRQLDLPVGHLQHDVRDFSAGQRKKVLLAASLCEQAHLYIWDEPLNFIDLMSRIQIEQVLLRYEPTLIFVEHDRRFCDMVATASIRL